VKKTRYMASPRSSGEGDGIGVFGGNGFAPVADGFADPLAAVGVIVVDAAGDIRLALLFFAAGKGVDIRRKTV
jgi:hypothetical protein